VIMAIYAIITHSQAKTSQMMGRILDQSFFEGAQGKAEALLLAVSDIETRLIDFRQELGDQEGSSLGKESREISEAIQGFKALAPQIAKLVGQGKVAENLTPAEEQVSRILASEGRNLGEVRGAIEVFAGRIVGKERNSNVLDYLLGIYAPSLGNSKTHHTEGEFAVLITTPDHLSMESAKAQLRVDPKLIIAVVAPGSQVEADRYYNQTIKRELPLHYENVLVIPASQGKTGNVFKELFSGKRKELLDKAKQLYPELDFKRSDLAKYTVFLGSKDELAAVPASKATKLVAPAKEDLETNGVSETEFNLYGNSLAFLIARRGGFDRLSREIPDINQGLVKMGGINEFGFDIGILKNTISQLVAKFQEFMEVSHAA